MAPTLSTTTAYATRLISRKKAVAFIRGRAGKLFAVRFMKRTTGEERTMVARQGVKAHLSVSPSKSGIEFEAHGLLPVYDMQRQGYRAVPVDGITAIKVNGIWINVK